jgi:hypothetical protein
VLLLKKSWYPIFLKVLKESLILAAEGGEKKDKSPANTPKPDPHTSAQTNKNKTNRARHGG